MGYCRYLQLRRLDDVPRRCCVLLRRRHNIPIRCRGEVPLRCLGDVPPRRCWVFHLKRTYDVAGTYRKTSLRRCYDVLLSHGNNIIFLFSTPSIFFTRFRLSEFHCVLEINSLVFDTFLVFTFVTKI